MTVGKFFVVGEAKDGKITFNEVLILAEIHFQVIFGSVTLSEKMSFRRKSESSLTDLDASFRWHDTRFPD